MEAANKDSFLGLTTAEKTTKDLQQPEGDPYDFVQVEAGFGHTVLLNSLGQVFSFGEGLQGQLGQE